MKVIVDNQAKFPDWNKRDDIKSVIEVINCVNVDVQKNIGLVSYEHDGKKLAVNNKKLK